jgi:pimeloyl-ACP methyl ester carboxylesterase
MIPLCPAGFVAVRLSFVMTAVAASVFPSPQTINTLGRTLVAPTSTMSDDDLELLDLSMRYHRVKLAPVLLLTPDDLARVLAPTLLLIGRHDAIFDARAMVERARRRLAHVQAEIIEDAGHGLNADQPEALHRRVLAFLRPVS